MRETDSQGDAFPFRTESAPRVAGGATLPVLALVFAAVLLVLPAAFGIGISLQDYAPDAGIFASPWAGMRNYLLVLKSADFLRAFLNTMQFSALSAAFLFALSVPFGYLLIAACRVRWLRHALATLLLLLLVIPGELWAQGFLLVFSNEGTKSSWLMPLWCSLKYLGLPALLVSAAVSRGNRRPAVPLYAGGAAALTLLALFGRADWAFLRVFAGSNYVETFVLAVPAETTLGAGAMAVSQILAMAVRTLLLAAIAVPVASLVGRLLAKAAAPDEARMRDRLIALIPCAAVALAAFAALAIASIRQGYWKELPTVFSLFTGYMLAAVLQAAVNTALCLALAGWLVRAGRAGKRAPAVALLALSALSLSARPYGEIILFRAVGLSGTWFALLLSGIGSVWGVWPLALAAKGRGEDGGKGWFRSMGKPALALWAVQSALQTNNTAPGLFYLSDTVNRHPVASFSTLLMIKDAVGRDPAANLAVLALVSLAALILPVAALLAVRTALGERDSLGLLLPGK